MAEILIIEDDAELSRTISDILIDEGHVVRSASTAEEGLRSMLEARPEVALIDVGLPDGSGLDLMRRAQEAGVGATLLLMSGDANDERIIDGLNGGAVDFLPKPFSMPLLKARTNAALRSRARSVETEHRIGHYRFSHSDQTLRTEEGRSIQLTRRESDILRKLLQSEGPVMRKTLLKEVWGYSDRVSTHTVETHIYRLRQKIEPDPGRPSIILTEGRGYVLAGF